MRITIQQVQEWKQRGTRFAMLTAYDYPTAKLLDEAGVPLLLVGDSLGVVVLGHETTIPVTMEDIIRCTQAVVRGTQRTLVVADLPFMSYQVSAEQAVANAGLLGGLGHSFVRPGDMRVLAATRLLGGGESDSVTFPVSLLEDGEDYVFFCSFPGHAPLMRGTLRLAD